MQDLTLVGVHDDGEHLVLSAPDGQKYTLIVDDTLRAAVRLDRARLGQLQIETSGTLRPRDIQARIRSGQTAEEIAVAAGVPLEHVRRFEGPVLAEREFVVRQAQAVRVRHPARSGGDAATLGDLVAERLAARAVDEDALVWDAWRGDDAVWMVSLSFNAGSRERQARWSYDAQLRHVVPRDDEARWLTEDDAEEPGARQRRLTPVGGSSRRDSGEGSSTEAPVRDKVYDVEADGGVRPVDEPRPAAVANATVDLLDSLRERRGRRQRTSPLGDAELAGGTLSDPMDAALHGTAGHGDALADPPAAHPPASRPDLAVDAEVLVLPDAETLDAAIGRHEYQLSDYFADEYHMVEATPAGSSPTDTGQVEEAPSSAASAEASVTAAPAAAGSAAGTATVDVSGTERAQARRARRPSVPKWDDIVFGSRRE